MVIIDSDIIIDYFKELDKLKKEVMWFSLNLWDFMNSRKRMVSGLFIN